MIKHTVVKIAFHLQWCIIAVALFFSAFAFGGIDPEAVYITRLLILFSLVLQIVLFCSEGRDFANFKPSFYIPLSLFFAFLILIFLQYFFGTIVLEGSWIGSVNVYATRESLIQLVYYFLFFMVCLNIASKREFVDRLGSLIAILVFIIAVLGLAQRLAGHDRIFWKSGASAEGTFFGPFVNENHFGGFLGLTFPLILGLMHYRFYQFQHKLAHDLHGHAKWLNGFEFLNTGAGFLFFLIIVALAASFYSFARLSSIVLLLCCFVYFVVYGMRQRKTWFYLILVLILGGSLLLLLRLGFDLGTSHLTLTDFQKAWHIRSEIAKQSLALFREFPFFGTGLGTYRFISSKVVSYLINEISYYHAENDFLELLIETGMVGFSLFLAPIVIILFFALKQIRKGPSHWNQFIVIQAATSILCIGVMEYFDFHLKIPTNALFFALQLALLFQAGFSRPIQDEPVQNKKLGRSPFYFKSVFLLLSLVLGTFLLWASTSTYRAYRFSQIGDDRLANLKKAVALQTSNAALWYDLGQELWAQTRTMTVTDGRALVFRQQAISALRKASALNPTDAFYWYSLGFLEYLSGSAKEGVASLEKAVYWAPQRLQYSVYLLAAYLKESEKARSAEKKVEFLKKAQILYHKLQSLEVKPRAGDYEVWMGAYYYQKLQQLAASWTS